MKSLTIVTPGAYPIPSKMCGSVEISVMNMLPYLASAFHVNVIGRKGDHTENHLADVPFVTPQPFPSEQLNFVQIEAASQKKYSSKMVSYIKKHPTTFVQVENRPRLALRIKKRVPNARIWLVLHSVNFISPKIIKRKTLVRAFRKCERIVVNSHFLKNHLLHRFPKLRSKVFVNHLGVNAAYFQPAHEHLPFSSLPEPTHGMQDTLKAMEGCPVVLFVGRLIRMKGVHHLLQAMSMVKSVHPNAKLVIVGSSRYGKQKQTSYVQHLHELSAAMGDGVLFQPHVPHLMLPYWYDRSNLFVCPSLKKEALGLVNLEAMASELPVIATNIGGIAEVMVNEQTGTLIPVDRHVERLAASICEFLANPEKTGRVGRQGRKHVVQHFTWEQSAQRLIQDYHKQR